MIRDAATRHQDLDRTPPSPAATGRAAEAMRDALRDHGFGPLFATPCGILAPLLALLEGRPDYHSVPREDNAVGMAVGAALAGARPAVLMQNSGLGQSVNALASLVVPYQVPILLVVSLRGVAPDPTEENALMGSLTPTLMAELGVPHRVLDPGSVAEQLGWAARVLRDDHRPAALLLPPQTFGWTA